MQNTTRLTEEKMERLADCFLSAAAWPESVRRTLGPAGRLLLGILIHGGDDPQRLSDLVRTYGHCRTATGRANLKGGFSKALQGIRSIFRRFGTPDGPESDHLFTFHFPDSRVCKATLSKNGEPDFIRLGLARSVRQQTFRLAGFESAALIGQYHQEVADRLEKIARRGLPGSIWLHGPSGVGKTSLLKEVKARCTGARALDGNVILLDLGSVASLEHAWREVADEVLPPSEEKSEEALLVYLRQCRTIILLDRLEAVPHAEDLIIRLTNAGSLATVIAASQLSLRPEYTVLHSIALRGIPEAYVVDRVQLFRYYASSFIAARGVSEGIHEDAPNADGDYDIATLCAHLQGNPLLIRFAAALAERMSLEDVLSVVVDVQSRLQNMVSPESSYSPSNADASDRRHRSEVTLLEYSASLLTPEAKRLLGQLLYFSDGFTYKAASAIYNRKGRYLGEDAHGFADAFRLLLDLNWIQGVVHRGGLERYVIPDLIKVFLDDHSLDAQGGTLRGDFREQTIREYRNYYLSLTRKNFQSEATPKQGYVFDELEAEKRNLEMCLGDPSAGSTSGLEIGTALQHFWFVRGHLRRGSTYLTEALTYYPERDELRAQARISLAWLDFWQGNIEKSFDAFSESRSISDERLQSEPDIEKRKVEAQRFAVAIIGMGQVHAYQGHYEEAKRLLEQGAIDGSDWRWEAIALNYLGMNDMYRGDYADSGTTRLSHYATARHYHDESLRLRRLYEHHLGIAVCLNRFSLLDLREGNYDEVIAKTWESLKIHIELGCVPGFIDSLEALAQVAFHRDEIQRAYRYFHSADTARRNYGFSALPVELSDRRSFEDLLNSSLSDNERTDILRECSKVDIADIANEAFSHFSGGDAWFPHMLFRDRTT